MSMSPSPRYLLLFAAAMALVALAGLIGLDRTIAAALSGPGGDPVFSAGIGGLDVIVGKEISTFLLGFVLLAVGGLLAAVARTRRIGWPILFVGACQFTATVAADLSKPLFGRLRPYESSAADTWFAVGNSFPSGHTAFYAALALPLVVLRPRAWPVLAVPLFVAAGRIVLSDHYLSDVAVSLALAALVTAGYVRLFATRLEGFRRPPE